MEAGTALGLSRLQIFRYIIMKPALRTVYPALTSQFIYLMLTSSVVSVISADDLAAAGNDIQSQTFASFEVYLVITAIYLVLSIGFSADLRGDRARRLHLSTEPMRRAAMIRPFGFNEFLLIAVRGPLDASRSRPSPSSAARIGGLLIALARICGRRVARDACRAASSASSRARRC